jgi:hypothetical protein
MIGKKIRVGSEEGGREGTPLFSPSRKNGDLFRMTSCVSDPKVITLSKSYIFSRPQPESQPEIG